jgi:hypothetical protein
MTTKICEKCENEMKLVPAGFSAPKNKAYASFWSCDKRNGGCGATAKAEGEEAERAPAPVHTNHLAVIEQKLDTLTEMVAQLAA